MLLNPKNQINFFILEKYFKKLNNRKINIILNNLQLPSY